MIKLTEKIKMDNNTITNTINTSEYTRVLKGMVFIYNIDESKDKKQFNTTKYNRSDYAEYGRRPWVVVSDNRTIDQICTIAPMSTGQFGKGDKIKTHVDFKLNGTNTCIMLEQMRFVNTHELKDYVTILGSNTMKLVDNAMAFHLGLREYMQDTKTISAVEEKVINDTTSDTTADILGSEGTTKTENTKETKTVSYVEKRGRKSKYNKEALKVILSDYNTLSEEDFCDKYKCRNHKAYLYKGYYVKKLYKSNFK